MNKFLAAMAAAAALAALGPATTALAQAPAAAAPSAAPQWEGVLKTVIGQLEAGQPDYDKMTPELAAATRQQADQVKQVFGQLGQLTALKFDQIGPQGAELYTATFEHGALRWVILVGADGKISGLGAMPAN